MFNILCNNKWNWYVVVSVEKIMGAWLKLLRAVCCAKNNLEGVVESHLVCGKGGDGVAEVVAARRP